VAELLAALRLPHACCRAGAALVFGASLLGAGRLPAAPLTFSTALPVAKGEFVFREQLVLKQSGCDPSGARRDATGRGAVSVLGYGASRRVALFGALPYFDKDLDLSVGGRVSSDGR